MAQWAQYVPMIQMYKCRCGLIIIPSAFTVWAQFIPNLFTCILYLIRLCDSVVHGVGYRENDILWWNIAVTILRILEKAFSFHFLLFLWRCLAISANANDDNNKLNTMLAKLICMTSTNTPIYMYITHMNVATEWKCRKMNAIVCIRRFDVPNELKCTMMFHKNALYRVRGKRTRDIR